MTYNREVEEISKARGGDNDETQETGTDSG